jgi:hypothetical protein
LTQAKTGSGGEQDAKDRTQVAPIFFTLVNRPDSDNKKLYQYRPRSVPVKEEVMAADVDWD